MNRVHLARVGCLLLSIATVAWAVPGGHARDASSASSHGQQAAAAADLKPYTETIPDSAVTFAMTPIPGGTFVMGSSETGPSPASSPRMSGVVA